MPIAKRPEIPHNPVAGRSCGHRHLHYALGCADYEALVGRSDGRCEICRIPGASTDHGYLVIDHNRDIGDWAVRGLLCSRCNTMLDSHTHVLDQDAVTQYLVAPWYQHMLALRGLGVELAPEPPMGTHVKLRWGLVAERRDTGWERVVGSARLTHRYRDWSWRGFYRQYGPHHMTVIAATGYSRETIRRLTTQGREVSAQG